MKISELIIKLEKENISESLIFGNYSSWIAVRQSLFTNKSLTNYSQSKKRTFKDFYGALCVIFFSLLFYIMRIFSEKNRIIFLGAYSGCVKIDTKLEDLFFPKEYQVLQSHYMLNCHNTKLFCDDVNYHISNKTVAENFLISIPIKIICKIFPFWRFFMKNKGVNKIYITLKDANFEIQKKTIASAHLIYCFEYLAYILFFKPLKCQSGFIVSSYTKSSACAALKKLGVFTTEIQHGFIGIGHPSYSYHGENETRKYLPLPDRVYVYNQFWKEEMLLANYLENQVIVYGKKRDIFSKNIISELSTKYNIKDYVIFTGQGQSFDKVESFLNGIIDELTKQNISLIYRPHPTENNNLTLFTKFNPRIKIIREFLTEDLIKYAKAHISIYSSCHFDAVHFLSKTYVLLESGSEWIEPYIKRNPASFIKLKDPKDFHLS